MEKIRAFRLPERLELLELPVDERALLREVFLPYRELKLLWDRKYPVQLMDRNHMN